MRFDMHKVIVERPRTYRGCRARRGAEYPRAALGRGRSLDELPTREAMGGRYAVKCLNENLAPLFRFLDGCVGRPWRAVYAELRARLDGASAVQAHVLQHLRDHVATSVFEQGGVMYATSTRGLLLRLEDPRQHAGLYVCPRTELLRAVAPIRARARAAHGYLARPDGTWWMRRPGGWFEVSLARLPARPASSSGVVDALSRARAGSYAHHAAMCALSCPWSQTHHAVGLRQLTRRELRVVFEGR